jgi:hypothetical protein
MRNNIKIDINLYDDIVVYCKHNNIENVTNFINKLIKIGLSMEKYDPTPFEVPQIDKVKIDVPKEVETINQVEEIVVKPKKNIIKKETKITKKDIYGE